MMVCCRAWEIPPPCQRIPEIMRTTSKEGKLRSHLAANGPTCSKDLLFCHVWIRQFPKRWVYGFEGQEPGNIESYVICIVSIDRGEQEHGTVANSASYVVQWL